MREILFKGKSLRDKQWHCGSFAIVKSVLFENEFIGAILPWYAVSFGHGNFRYEEPVDLATVCQYTGLKDRNGDRIFEGDIVQIWWLGDESDPPVKYKAVVEFGNPNCEFNWGYQLRPLDYIPYNLDILLWVEGENDRAFCEIIGNIHDNPELLEVNNDVPV